SQLQRQLHQLVGINKQVAFTAKQSALAFEAFDQAKRSIDQLRMSYDPLFAKTKQYEAAVDTLNNALRLGVMTQGQYDTALERVGQSYLTAAGQAKVYGTAMRASTAHTANLMFQFQDIGMMLAAGQSPLMLAMQQGTQVSGIFQQLKNSGQSLRGALGGAFAAMLSPMSFLTIGTIAAGAALLQWAFSAGEAEDAADELEDRLDELSSIMSTVKAATEILEMSTEELAIKYGTAADRVRELAVAESELARAQLERQLRDQIALMDDVIDRYTGISEATNGMSGAAKDTMTLAMAITDLRKDLGVTRQEAELLSAQFRDFSNAGDFPAQQEELRKILATLNEMGVPLNKLPETLQDAISEMIALSNETDAAAEAARRLAEEYDSIVIPSMGRGDPRDFTYIDEFRKQLEDQDNWKPPSKGSKGGGTNQRESQLESLIKSLQTERETLEAWRVEQFDLLAQFNDQELEAIGGHNEAKLRLEREYQSRIASIRAAEGQTTLNATASLFGSLQSIAQSSGERGVKAAAVFGGIQATIAAYVAAAKAMAESPGNSMVRLAAYASVLTTGLGAVAAI
ncbi:MAG: phage tail length tape measure family protein, partial [Anaerolineae bacterium]|nr:phage tail length tape measure family protein [Anaerolineae bacterium]